MSTRDAIPDMERTYTSLLSIVRSHEQFILDNDGYITNSNLGLANITGYDEQEIIGKHISIFYLHEESDLASQDLEAVREHGRLSITGLKIKKRDKTFWARMKFRALRNRQGDLTGFKVNMYDATHLVYSKLRTRTIRKEYKAIFNNPLTGIFKFRMSDLKLISLNEKAQVILGFADYTQHYFNEVFADYSKFEQFTADLRENKNIQVHEFEVKNVNHKTYWLNASCIYFPSLDIAEGVFVDITESKEQLHQLERVNSELDRFIYHSSHDLRSPIATMLGLTNLIRLDKSREMIGEYNIMMEERIAHLDSLLKDLVAIAFNRRAELTAERIFFGPELELISREFEISNNYMKVERNVEEDYPFYSDQIRIRSLLRALFSTAVNYTKRNINNSFVKICVRTSLSHATLFVEDNGLGIGEEQQHRAFDMFFKGDPQVRGTGLTLYIVKAVIDKLKGTIEVQSKRGMGTRINIILPSQFSQSS